MMNNQIIKAENWHLILTHNNSIFKIFAERDYILSISPQRKPKETYNKKKDM